MRRRPWLRRALITWIVGALALLVYGVAVEPARLVERDYTFALPNWPQRCDGLRIDQITDVHTGSPRNGLANLDRVVTRLASSDASAVVMTGDYVIKSVFLGTYLDAAETAPHLRALTRHKPVYAVLGNHDVWKGGPAVQRALEKAGVIVIEDSALKVQLRGCPLWIVGVSDLWTEPHDVRKAFAAVTDDAPAIVLTHNPAIFPQLPARASLVLAGHTHGGQISLPWVGQPAMWGKPGNRYVTGHYDEHGRQLFVSPGIGTSILPMRIGVPPEISRLTLRTQGVGR